MNHIDLQNILFLDIETVSGEPNFEALSGDMQELWANKTKWQRKEDITAKEYYADRAGILAEFGKIVCISVGFIHYKDGMKNFRLRSFYNHDEALLLGEFAKCSKKNTSTTRGKFCVGTTPKNSTSLTSADACLLMA